ncbi:MAG: hypothetical protein AAFQ22_02720 [Pseudomonadota bacterium]
MPEPSGRIWFPGNPWPDGHALKEMELWGILSGEGHPWALPGLHLHLCIRSQDYDSEMGEAERDAAYDGESEEIDRGIDRSSWQSYIVWGNYHACRIETNVGPRLGSDSEPFALDWLAGRRFELDPVDPDAEYIDFDSQAFHCYILGHDAVAGHDLHLKASEATGHFDIDWSGKVALAYGGDDVYRYDFRAEMRSVPFQGFMAPAWFDLVKEKRGLFGKTETRSVNRRDGQSLEVREAALRELAARYLAVPQEALAFEARKHKDWLRLKI